MKNVHGNITKALQKRLGLDFSPSFSFFSLISVKTSYKWCWTPSLQPLTPIYRKMRGVGCMIARLGELVASSISNLLAQASSARPGELVASPLSFLMGPGVGKYPKVTILPLFWTFYTFPSETSQNPSDCTVISVKQFNSTSKNPNINQRSSPDENRVWQSTVIN